MSIFFWMDVYRNAFTQLRMGVSQINVHQHRFSPTARNVDAHFVLKKKKQKIFFCLNVQCMFS